MKIGFQPFIPDTFQPVAPSVSFPVHDYRALLDTGAQRTCLCRQIIAKEGLTHHGKRPIQNVHGVERHYLYWVNIGFVCERLETLQDRITETTYFALPDPTEVIDIAENYWFDAIIGMDLLSRCDLHLERDGSFALVVG